MRKEIRGECSVFDCHTCCYPDKVKLYCQMTPNMKWQTACFFHKTQIHNQSCCLMKRKMNQCVFLAGLKLQLSRFKRGKSYFGISPQLSVSPKLVSLQFPNCVKTLLGNTMPFHGKIYQGRVFGECSDSVDCHTCCYLDYLKLYCQMTFQQQMARNLFLSDHSNNRPKLL